MTTIARARILPLLTNALDACCSPVTAGVLDQPAAEALAGVFKALGDPTRVRLLSLIAAHADGEACVCDLTDPVGLSQPTVSHHLKQLVEAGLITREQRGKWAYYRVVQPALDAVADSLRRPTT
ncbi:metalloregulator ArsR/SmtB family transcription factor [Acidothermaceae bacterium B102]|nr:metalloregulator ArsR/SmtB family transcription factor [Acidothermaceae bacterium B102]